MRLRDGSQVILGVEAAGRPRGRDSVSRVTTWLTWREAMDRALYGPDGFYRRAGGGPAEHFRTSAHNPVFGAAVAALLRAVDEALGFPATVDFVDVGAGRGELISAVAAALREGGDAVPGHAGTPGEAAEDALPGHISTPGEAAEDALPGRIRTPESAGGRLLDRVRFRAVEVGPRPSDLPESVEWSERIPDGIEGLLIANEWLDNVVCDVAEVDADGVVRIVEVDTATGAERLGPLPSAEQAAWLARWWPLDGLGAGARAEIGLDRDAAWRRAVASVTRGAAVAIDYAHVLGERPEFGTMTGYRDGQQVEPVPDGSCDVTAHVALDACAAAVAAVPGTAALLPILPEGLLTQREALHRLGVNGRRPPLDLAHSDPRAYLRALSRASAAAELTEPAGLGGFGWLVLLRGLNRT